MKKKAQPFFYIYTLFKSTLYYISNKVMIVYYLYAYEVAVFLLRPLHIILLILSQLVVHYNPTIIVNRINRLSNLDVLNIFLFYHLYKYQNFLYNFLSRNILFVSCCGLTTCHLPQFNVYIILLLLKASFS